METHPKLFASGKSDIGLRRANNEDSLYVQNEAEFFLVADGMGGAVAGEVASQIFTDSTCQTIPLNPGRTEVEAVALIKESFLAANRRIRAHIKENPEHDGMGCTADLLLFHNEGFALGHIGDSRTYRLRGRKLTSLTKDHSLIQEQIESGLISEKEAQTHRLRNVINRAVGVSDQLKVDIIRGSCVVGDLFLLCSDGLTDMVEDYDIEKILLTKESLATMVSHLIERAKAGGGYDNISVVLVGVGRQ